MMMLMLLIWRGGSYDSRAPDPSTTQWPHCRGVGAEQMYGSAARILVAKEWLLFVGAIPLEVAHREVPLLLCGLD